MLFVVYLLISWFPRLEVTPTCEVRLTGIQHIYISCYLTGKKLREILLNLTNKYLLILLALPIREIHCSIEINAYIHHHPNFSLNNTAIYMNHIPGSINLLLSSLVSVPFIYCFPGNALEVQQKQHQTSILHCDNNNPNSEEKLYNY